MGRRAIVRSDDFHSLLNLWLKLVSNPILVSFSGRLFSFCVDLHFVSLLQGFFLYSLDVYPAAEREGSVCVLLPRHRFLTLHFTPMYSLETGEEKREGETVKIEKSTHTLLVWSVFGLCFILSCISFSPLFFSPLQERYCFEFRAVFSPLFL